MHPEAHAAPLLVCPPAARAAAVPADWPALVHPLVAGRDLAGAVHGAARSTGVGRHALPLCSDRRVPGVVGRTAPGYLGLLASSTFAATTLSGWIASCGWRHRWATWWPPLSWPACYFALDTRRLAMEIILGTLTLWLLVETIKALTDRARPFLDLGEARIIGWRERGRSFPSGHTAQTFFLVTLFSHQFQPGPAATIALFAVAALVGFTRMYVGAHYPRDVLAARCWARCGESWRRWWIPTGWAVVLAIAP